MKKFAIYFIFLLFVPTILTAQVKLNEVRFAASGAEVELKNFGSTAVDVSSWWLCARFFYTQIGGMTIVSGTLNIPAGGILAVSGGGMSLNSTSSDLGLYSSSVFASSSAMEDFVQWGSSGIGRESVASSKGIWTPGDFVNAVAQDHSIEYDGDGTSSSDWVDQANPTIGAENGVVTSVEDDDISVPDDFDLAQNFPNPFNPETVIQYQVNKAAEIELTIFNMLGQPVRHLVSEKVQPGQHSVVWNGANDLGRQVASGIYIYQLQAGKSIQSRRMILMR
ncbi:MAG: T9SS type A sorting domain-containing protein [bacterium]